MSKAIGRLLYKTATTDKTETLRITTHCTNELKSVKRTKGTKTEIYILLEGVLKYHAIQ